MNAARILDPNELSRMHTARDTINQMAERFIAAHGLQAGSFAEFIDACFGEQAA